jgi:hypothetical protein
MHHDFKIGKCCKEHGKQFLQTVTPRSLARL